jgi:hypothetical protein
MKLARLDSSGSKGIFEALFLLSMCPIGFLDTFSRYDYLGERCAVIFPPRCGGLMFGMIVWLFA